MALIKNNIECKPYYGSIELQRVYLGDKLIYNREYEYIEVPEGDIILEADGSEVLLDVIGSGKWIIEQS